MEKHRSDAGLVVDRYLAGKLSDEELAEFEERVTWDRELLDELELSEKLRDGMRDVGAESGPQSAPFAGTRVRWPVSSIYAAAASFVGGVMLTALIMSAPEPPGFSDSVPVSVMALEAFRSETGPQLVIDPEALAVLLVDVSDRASGHAATLTRRPDDLTVWSASGVRAGEDGRLALGIPGRLLSPGDYVLSVYVGSNLDAPAARVLPFRAVSFIGNDQAR